MRDAGRGEVLRDWGRGGCLVTWLLGYSGASPGALGALKSAPICHHPRSSVGCFPKTAQLLLLYIKRACSAYGLHGQRTTEDTHGGKQRRDPGCGIRDAGRGEVLRDWCGGGCLVTWLLGYSGASPGALGALKSASICHHPRSSVGCFPKAEQLHRFLGGPSRQDDAKRAEKRRGFCVFRSIRAHL